MTKQETTFIKYRVQALFTEKSKKTKRFSYYVVINKPLATATEAKDLTRKKLHVSKKEMTEEFDVMYATYTGSKKTGKIGLALVKKEDAYNNKNGAVIIFRKKCRKLVRDYLK